ncbi:hypothetical protein C8R43DRAFT_1131881 [Mycena crocata]|nr:hypothetical protein C8R43DRAFT_1131881 [Mycena crocata]
MNIINRNAIYQRRQELLNVRIAELTNAGFSNRVKHLAQEAECHSDDEQHPDTEFMVHEKEGRDPLVTDLFRALSAGRSQSEQHKRGRKLRRKRTPGLGPSEMSRKLPKNVPIDFFSPSFFNSLPAHQREIYMGNGVTLPTAEFCQSWKDILAWKDLGEAEFMNQFGNAKLALYNLPTPADLSLDGHTYNDNDWVWV